MDALYVAVVGQAEPDEVVEGLAYEVGRLLAESGVTVLTGGLATGVMGAAARGAREAGGTVVGVLPDFHDRRASPDLATALTTGLHELRNGVLVNSSRAVIAIGGGWGTLSEVALALRQGKTVASLASWVPTPPGSRTELRGPVVVATAEEAVAVALAAIAPGPAGRASLWLEPLEGGLLQRCIDDAARRCGVPPFAAHLTLASVAGVEAAEAVSGAARVAARLSAVVVERAGFASFDGERHRALFVVLRRTPAFEAVLDLVRHELPGADPAGLAHMSLVYGSPGSAATPPTALLLEVLREAEALLPRQIALGRLTVRSTSGDDHTAWSGPLAEWELRPG